MNEPVVPDAFRKLCGEPFGIRPKHAIEAVLEPDQTIVLEQSGLVLQIHSRWVARAKPQHHLVVIERLESAARTIHMAFKIYPDLFDAGTEPTPVEMLERLAHHFGVEITVGATRSKFIHAARVPVSDSGDIRLAEGSRPASMIQSMYFKIDPGPPRSAECALCFCLDRTSYQQWLAQHWGSASNQAN